jgi:flagellar assembly factor FliW
MPTISIKGQNFEYSADDVLTFPEGLIGLPQMRSAALVPLADCEPFAWLASLDDETTRFIVMPPGTVFATYSPAQYLHNQPTDDALVIVRVSSDWRRTTVNLRAPILIDSTRRAAVQVVLADSPYGLAEPLPSAADE